MRLRLIVLDEELRARGGLDPIAVQRMVTAWQAGARFPPLIIERRTRRLVDGWTRHAAYQILGVAETEVETRRYQNEAELFADAVRLNVAHGQPLTGYDLRQAIARLEKLGITRDQLTEIVRIPAPRIDEIVRGFGWSPTGEPVALKRGLRHLRGEQLSSSQLAAIKRHGGQEATFFARQLALLLQQDLWPRDNANFRTAMNELVALWLAVARARHGMAGHGEARQGLVG